MTIAQIFLAIFASVGFWNVVLYKVQRRDKLNDEKKEKNTDTDMLIMGIACHMIKSEATKYIERGSITTDEYTELNKYLFKPYENKGGNGTCKKLMTEIDKLPIKEV